MDVATVPAAFVRQDERGTFIDVVKGGRWETVITGRMRPGAVLGNHYHKLTELFLFVSEGSCQVDVECVKTGRRRSVHVAAGHGLHLHPFESHAIRFDTASTFILLKSRAYNPDDPDTYEYPVTVDTARAAADCPHDRARCCDDPPSRDRVGEDGAPTTPRQQFPQCCMIAHGHKDAPPATGTR